MNTTNKAMNDEVLNDVSGGGWLSSYSNEEYEAAGVEVIGPGNIYNDGYKYRGKEISRGDANAIVEFFKAKGYKPGTIVEARNFQYHQQKIAA